MTMMNPSYIATEAAPPFSSPWPTIGGSSDGGKKLGGGVGKDLQYHQPLEVRFLSGHDAKRPANNGG